LPGTVKYAGLIVCAVIALVVWRMTPRKRDGRLQVVTFCFTVIADYFLLFTDDFAIGVIIFWGAHLSALVRYRRQWLQIGIALTGVGAVICTIMALTGRSIAVLYTACIVYAVLILSVTVAAFLYKQPKAANICSRLGMVLFLCCDINVAIFNTATPDTPLYNTSAPLMWLFYLPAQILLSLSASGGALTDK
jgi:hypothetical protein